MTGLFVLSGQMDGWKTMSLMLLTLLHAPLTCCRARSYVLARSLGVFDIHLPVEL